LDWFDHPRRQRTVKIKGTPRQHPRRGHRDAGYDPQGDHRAIYVSA
jgi:hypothetical protein